MSPKLNPVSAHAKEMARPKMELKILSNSCFAKKLNNHISSYTNRFRKYSSLDKIQTKKSTFINNMTPD